MTNVLRRAAYRVLMVAVVPILWMARDITGSEAVRGPARGPRADVAGRTFTSGGNVPPVQLSPMLPAREPTLVRDPFTFAPRRVSPGPAPSPVFIPAVPAPPPEMPTVALSLIGVATTTRADGGVERTAIIAGPADALYFVREADAVTTRYRVDAVLPDSVVLADVATGVALRLILR